MVLLYSPGFYPFSGTCPDFYFLGTRSDSTLFRYSPGFHLSGTHLDFYFFGTLPDSTLLRYSPGFLFFWYSFGFYLFGTLLDSTFLILTRISTFLVLAWILPFPVLTRIQPNRYSLRPFFGTRPDSYFFRTRLDSTLLRCLPGFHYLFRQSLGFYPSLVLA